MAKLIIKSNSFQKQALVFLNALSSDPVCSQEFIKNPLKLVSKYFKQIDLSNYSKSQISEVNNFLFKLLSNRPFISWLKEYRETNISNLKIEAMEKQVELRDIIMKDVAAAMLKFGDFADLENMFELSGDSGSNRYNPVYDEIFVVIKGVVLLLVVVTQIDINPLVLRQGKDLNQLVNMAQLKKVSAAILKYSKDRYGK